MRQLRPEDQEPTLQKKGPNPEKEGETELGRHSGTAKLCLSIQQAQPPSFNLPRMELPPLSPGIHAKVIDEAEVLDTISRG